MVEATNENEYYEETLSHDAIVARNDSEEEETCYLLNDEFSSQFKVHSPVNVQGRIAYMVKGVDNDGEFEVRRRYNDFHHLHTRLTERWPGIIIPPIPPKNPFQDMRFMTHGMNVEFCDERRNHLERFLRKLCKIDFLLNSEEVKIFFRHTDEYKVGSQLIKLPALSAMDKYSRIAQVTQIDES